MVRVRALAGSLGLVVLCWAGAAWSAVPGSAAECLVDEVACEPSPAPAGNDLAGAAQLLALINADRTSAGLPLMVARDDVTTVAVTQSTAMAEAGDIWHNDAYFTADMRRRLGARTLGENVAMNRSVLDAHQRLMASPGHHANLVNPRFTVVGLAVVRDAGGIGYVTEDFVEPLPAGATPGSGSPDPAPAPAPSSGGSGAGGVAAQSASRPVVPPSPARPPAVAATAAKPAEGPPAPVSGETAAPPTAAALSSSARELSRTAGDAPPARPVPTDQSHVPLWTFVVAAAGLAVIAGRLVLAGRTRRARPSL